MTQARYNSVFGPLRSVWVWLRNCLTKLFVDGPGAGPKEEAVTREHDFPTPKAPYDMMQPTAASPLDTTDFLRLLSEIGTGLWRMRRRLLPLGADELPDGMTSALRHMESLWDALTEAGVEIHDHTGELFDPGMAVKSLAFQPTPKIVRETVIETIRPTIYFRESRIQLGEVIVGTPENPPGSVTQSATGDVGPVAEGSRHLLPTPLGWPLVGPPARGTCSATSDPTANLSEHDLASHPAGQDEEKTENHEPSPLPPAANSSEGPNSERPSQQDTIQPTSLDAPPETDLPV